MQSVFRAGQPRTRAGKRKCKICRTGYVNTHTCEDKFCHRNLRRLAAFVGGTLSHIFMDRLRLKQFAKQIWGPDGQIQHETKYNEPYLKFIHEMRYDKLIEKYRDSSLGSKQVISLNEDACNSVKSLTHDATIWKAIALRAVAYTFPEHRYFAVIEYPSIVKTLLPNLQAVLPYLSDFRVLEELTDSDVMRIGAVCLSSSFFRDTTWKSYVVDIAETLLKNRKQDISGILLRKLQLARLAGQASTNAQIDEIQSLRTRFKILNARSNAEHGEMILFQARLLIDSEKLEDAKAVLAEFSLWDGSPSLLEKIQKKNIKSVEGEIHRYNGQFADARRILGELMEQPPIPQKISSHFCAVLCELKDFNAASHILNDEYDTDTKDGPNATRVHLALAEAHVMQATHIMMNQHVDMKAEKVHRSVLVQLGRTRSLLEKLSCRFEQRKLTKVGQINNFRFLVAYAIVEHLSGDPLTAIERWNEAVIVSRGCWTEGFFDAVIAFSKADLLYGLDKLKEAQDQEEYARRLRREHKPRYFFTGLGTTWPTYVDTSMRIVHERHGLLES